MLTADTIKELQELSSGLTLLYVEDNDGLRENALKLLQTLFTNVLSASDGQKGYELFKKHRPQIVLTDIRMPKLDGMQMLKQIKQLQPSTKFIITSAYDEKDYLFQAIDLGVFHYMKKPFTVDTLLQTLTNCIHSISADENSSLFNTYMEDMLNYQRDLLALVSKGKPLFVNQMFLDFFNVENVNAFDDKYTDFGSLLLEHKGFLYNHDQISWFDESSSKPGKLFHVKIKDQNDDNRHFILKMHALPKKENIYIMSLNDITDLDLLALFDSKAVENDDKIKSRRTIVNLLEIIQKNSTEIKIHNFYKGLTITNIGLVEKINNEDIIVKTTFMQQKAAQNQKSILISSEIFPSAILCEPIKKIDFENQTISFKEVRFLARNPTQRRSVRVAPEEHHSISFFFEKRKFYGDIRIHDISIEAMKLEMSALPAGLKEKTAVSIDMVLEHDRKPLIINTPASVFRIEEMSRSFFVVVSLELTSNQKKQLIDYVAKRQMNLIREFKGLQFG